MGITEQETRVVMSPIQFIDRGPGGELPAPLVRVRCCGMIEVQVLGEVVSTDPPLGRYKVIQPQTLRGRGAVPALMLLKLLVSQPHRFGSTDWLSTQMQEEMEKGSLVRLDTMASQLRSLLCGLAGEQTSAVRLRLVEYLRNGRGSGPGYRLAPSPLIWLDTDALAWNVEQGARMERFGHPDSALAFWQRASALASRGTYLPDDLYSNWAVDKRAQVEGALRQSVHALSRLSLSLHGQRGKEEVIALLRSYWLAHQSDEDALRPLLELLGERECYQEAEQYYQQLCEALDATERGKQPDERTRDIREFLRTRQIQRKRVEAPTTIEVTQLSPTDGQNSAYSFLSQVISPAIIEAVRDLGGQQYLDNRDLQSSTDKLSGTSFLELQQILSQEVISQWPNTKDNTGYLLSRRQVLLALASLAMPLLATSQQQSSSSDVEELLSSVAISIDACWQLSNQSDIMAVYSAVSTYLPPLVAITRQFLSYRKAAAHLAAQAFLLKAIMGRHVISLQAAEAFGREAVRYSQMAEDPVFHVITLRHLAMIYFYTRRHKEELALYQQMKPLLSLAEIPPLVRSFVYAGWAGTQAINGLRQETLTTLALARETLSMQSATEACPLYVDYDYSQLFISEGLAYYDLGLYQEALNSFLQVDGSSPKIPVAERGRLEFLNCQALTILRLPQRDRDMQQCIDYWMAGVQGAVTLKSKQRYDEACRIYEFMEFA